MTATVDAPDQAPDEPMEWTDGKRYLWLLGLAIPLLPFIAWGLVSATGLGVFWWWGPIFLYGILPVLDTIIGTDPNNPPEAVVARLDADRYYRWCTYAYLPLQFAALAFACWNVSTGHLAWFDMLGLAVTMGVVSGVAINTAHELGHKRLDYERWLSKVALSTTGYGHFFIEHNRGHHVRVATPEDPASSRMGESLFVFFPRTVIGSFRSAWGLERTRLGRQHRHTWSVHNGIINAWAMSVVVFGALIAVFGVKVIPLLAVQAVFGFMLLEVVNYLEHYGLRRQREANGRYERCRPDHSWNSNNIASNLVLYHLQRHSDHHANPTRRFQALRQFDEAPQLPSGYGTMIVLAYFPPLWRKVMDPRVIRHYDGDLTRAALQPGKADAILARHPVPAG